MYALLAFVSVYMRSVIGGLPTECWLCGHSSAENACVARCTQKRLLCAKREQSVTLLCFPTLRVAFGNVQGSLEVLGTAYALVMHAQRSHQQLLAGVALTPPIHSHQSVGVNCFWLHAFLYHAQCSTPAGLVSASMSLPPLTQQVGSVTLVRWWHHSVLQERWDSTYTSHFSEP
jgi:hypothetical protein